MKNLGLTFLMMLFIGVGTSMAQDKQAAIDSDAGVSAKTEMSAEKAHKCAADGMKSCCAKKSQASETGKKECTGDKMACAPGCEKTCCTADAGKAKMEKHNHPQ